MQLGALLRRRDVQRAIALVILAVIAALAQRASDRFSGVPASGDVVEGHPRLVDGDSFHLGSGEVRLKGIDAPEGPQSCRRNGRDWRCGDAARDELRRLIGGQKISCKVLERDQHGRILGTCRVGDRDLGAAMVSAGMALSYGGYAKEEMQAKLARRGLWGAEFQRPRDWRRDHGIGGRGGA